MCARRIFNRSQSIHFQPFQVTNLKIFVESDKHATFFYKSIEWYVRKTISSENLWIRMKSRYKLKAWLIFHDLKWSKTQLRLKKSMSENLLFMLPYIRLKFLKIDILVWWLMDKLKIMDLVLAIILESIKVNECRLTISERQAGAYRKDLGKQCKHLAHDYENLKSPWSYNKNARYLNMLIILYWVKYNTHIVICP